MGLKKCESGTNSIYEQFKSSKGVDNFLILRSITDTTLKNKQSELNALILIASLPGTDWIQNKVLRIHRGFWFKRSSRSALS